MEFLTRRKLLGGLAAFIAAPAIIRVAGIMPIKAFDDWIPLAYPDPEWFVAYKGFDIYRSEFIEAFNQRQMLIGGFTGLAIASAT